MLSLLTIFALKKGEAKVSGTEFLNSLRANLPALRGLGPTTRAALGIELREQEKVAIHDGKLVIGNTNGGMMRTAVIGLAYDPSEDIARREMVAALTLATHKDQKAVDCAVLASRLYSDATSNGSSNSLFSLLIDELGKMRNPTPEVSAGIKNLENWIPPEEGISLDPLETLSAVFWTVTHAKNALDSYRIACELGGDTDTVAALATGLLAAREPIESGLLEISWLDEVLWSEIPTIGSAVSRLLEYRIGANK
jgi:ADP-ribosylglycohydrolase